MNGNTQHSTFQSFLLELRQVFIPLADPSTAEELVGRMSLSGDVPQAVQDLSSLAATLQNALSGEATPEAIAGIQEPLLNLYEAIQELSSGNIPQDWKNANFPRLLIDYLIADYFRTNGHEGSRTPALTNKNRKLFYHLVAIIGWVRFNEDHLDEHDAPVYGNKPIAWEDLPAFFTDTANQIKKAGHRWGTADFAEKYPFLLHHLGEILNIFHESAGIPKSPTSTEEIGDDTRLNVPLLSGSYESPSGSVSASLDAFVDGLDAGSGKLPGLSIGAQGNAEVSLEMVLKPNLLYLLLESGIDFTSPFTIELRPDGLALKQGALDISGYFIAGLRAERPSPTILLGDPAGSRTEVKSVTTKIGLRLATGADMEFFGELGIEGGRIVIKGAGDDGFLNKLLPADGINATFDVTVGWSNLQGVYFSGSGGLEVHIAAHIDLGPVQVQGIHIGIFPEVEKRGFRMPVGTDVQLQLGPFTAVAQNIGINSLITFPEGGGNLGPANVDIGFKPPNGLGLALETPTISGGGYLFFDFEKGEYAGVAELTIQQMISVKAIGIINTKAPDGGPGFSFLLLITAEFQPIQLGFGFTLNGVGGLIAINRGMNLEALAEGVRTNAINSVMFPEDPVAEAPRIISDMNRFFPIAEGRYTFGLMGIIGWGTPTLIEVQLGVIIHVPDPVILAIMGVVKIALPDKRVPVISLNINFIGAIDFDEGYMFFFAALYDSRLLTYSLEGEMYFMISWGDQPNFLLSVGGFHPAFKAPPLRNVSGPLKRITLNLLPGDNPRLTLTMYFAVTSNTVQLGARADFFLKVWKVRIIGYLYFDALFQFNPFYFRVDIGAGLGVYMGSSELFGIHLKGSLEGPTPWRIKGTASFKILFIKIKVRVSKTWGERKFVVLPPKPVLPLLVEALEDTRNWQSTLPGRSELLVTLREKGEEELVLHPAGVLSLSQNKIPLDLRLDKVGNERPSDYNRFKLRLSFPDAAHTDPATSQLRDYFAPGEFLQLTDSQKLSRKSFERIQSGLRLEGGDAFISTDAAYTQRDYEYEQLILDTPDTIADRQIPGRAKIEQETFDKWVKGNAVALSEKGKAARDRMSAPDQAVQQQEDTFLVVSKDDLSPIALNGQKLEYGSETEAIQVMEQMELLKPELSGRMQVLPAYETMQTT